jgi:hypothetical protein
MKITEVIAIINDINNTASNRGVPFVHEKYANNHHPEIDYHIGVLALQNDYERIGKTRLISCVSAGVAPPYPWFQTTHSNAIGQCAALLLTKNLLTTTDQEVIGKLFVFGYLNLSSCINQLGMKAYQSYETRGTMFLECNFPNIVFNYFKHIGVSGEVISMLNAYDIYKSSLGYSSDPLKKKELTNKAIKMIKFFSENVTAIPSIDEFIQSTEPIQSGVYEKLSGFIRMGVTIKGQII